MNALARYRADQARLKASTLAFYEWVREERKTKSLAMLARETGLTTQRIFQIVKSR